MSRGTHVYVICLRHIFTFDVPRMFLENTYLTPMCVRLDYAGFHNTIFYIFKRFNNQLHLLRAL